MTRGEPESPSSNTITTVDTHSGPPLPYCIAIADTGSTDSFLTVDILPVLNKQVAQYPITIRNQGLVIRAFFVVVIVMTIEAF